MIIVHVFVHVKSDKVEEFKKVSIENAENSIMEPGIARFEVIQQNDEPTRFVLVEVYRTLDDTAFHKQTKHYKKWRDAVADMMVEPRIHIKYKNVYPDEEGWNLKNEI